VWGGLGPVRYAVAVQNGVPLDDRPGAVTDVFAAKKTLVGRLGLEELNDTFELGVGVSALQGTGFHSGTTETKSALSWRDANQDGLVSLNELVAVPGQAATASSTFERWGVNADGEGGFSTPLGWTRLYAEVTIAQNLDRSLFVADPVSTGYDLREIAWTASALQEIGPYVLVGLRGDVYNPDADLFEQRRGLFEPVNATLKTVSPLVGVQLPDRARLSFQYDRVFDQLARDSRGIPAALSNDHWTLRLQVGF
jgi:hypothetical protein